MSWGAFRFGPVARANGTDFRLWAPDAEAVMVEVRGDAPVAMSASGQGWFEAETAAFAGARYRFRMGDAAFPDPAARAMDGDVHGWSIVPSTDDFAWTHRAWRGRPWEEAVIYEAHAGVMGGFNGLVRYLPRLKALGITALELMPVADFPGERNWGYDGVLPFAPDEAYGTPEDLKRLVDAAHGHGLMVFLDVVYNHFGPDGNYLALHAKRFFHADETTPWGQAIDFGQAPVRRFFIENALYWLNEFRFDGLRFDAVHAIPDRDFLEELAGEIKAKTEPGRHVHLIVENENNQASLLERFTVQWNDDLHHALHVLLTGEADAYYADYADRPAERLARALREGFVYQGEPSAHSGGPRGERSAHLPPTSFVSFLQNHDQTGNRAFGERLTALADERKLKAAIALLLLAPPIPMIFMGEEAGAPEPFLYFTAHRDEKLAAAVRDGRRKEFARFPNFRDAEARARIADPNAPQTYARSHPTFDGAEWGAFYKQLLALRHSEIVPRLKGARALDAKAVSEMAVVAQWRMNDGARLTIAVNLGDGCATAPLPVSPPLWGAAQGNALGPRATVCWLDHG